MNDEQRKRMLPELMRFACDPQLDAMTRSWLFDALRNISGQSLGDDSRLWRAWYLRATGTEVAGVNDSHESLVAGALLQP